MRLADRGNWLRPAHRAHLQSRAAQLHPDQAALGQRTRARNLRAHRPRPLPQGLRPLPPHRQIRHRRARGQRNPAAGRNESSLVLPSSCSRRHSRKLAAAVFESPEVCAQVSPEAASLTGLTAGTPVVAGAGDQGAGAVGMGILQPGSVSATIGTSGVVFAATASPIKDPKGRLHTFCHAVPGRWHVMGVTQSAGLSYRWLSETFFAGQNYDATYRSSRISPSRQRRPRMGALSARRTHPASRPRSATAAFIGITTHTAAHFVRAVLEGVAFSLQDTFRSSPSSAFQSTASASAEAVHAVRSGVRFKLASTATLSKS